jgi:Protein of unknown function (DUF3048) N-terminal domain/Protein of unknown function (DUF3048) C-terminal domain
LHSRHEPRSGAALIWTRHKAVITTVAAVAIVAALVAGLLLAPRGGGQARKTAATRPAAPRLVLSPFTGEPVSSLNRVLAVKIDNIVFARPQTGLSHADIVYVLPVEGGLSRFMAVFSSDIPPVIGPVRSAREDDLELLRQFGRPAFAYSGATATLLPYIHQTARIVDLFDGIASGYFRSNSRIAPYNLYANARQLLRQAPRAIRAHDIGFRFGPPPRGGRPTRSASVSYPAASFLFIWSPARHGWLVSMDGTRAMTTDAGRLAPATVVIMHTTVRTSRFLEYGKPPPYAESVGSGVALVLRDGRAWTTRWSRPSPDAGTTFTTAFGQRMTFAPGQVWVVLAYR